MDELIRRLRGLPKGSLVCQGGIIPLPELVREKGGPPFRPMVALWAEPESRSVHCGGFLSAGDDVLRAALETLGEFVQEVFDNEVCPGCLEVRDPTLAEYLRNQLADACIEVRVADELSGFDQAAAELCSLVESRSSGPPGMMSARGMTVDRLRSFADAAATFYRAAPWRYLADVDLIQIESPKAPRGMAFCVVLGAGGCEFGLGLYPSRDRFEQFLRAAHEPVRDASLGAGLSHVTFEALNDLPIDDAALWIEHQLPAAGERAYPIVLKHLVPGKTKRPSSQELTFLEGLFRSLAAASEEEIDSGRFRKEITTHDGAIAFTLALPDLLAPPSPRQWMDRGFVPDRRSHERMFADVERYFQEHPTAEGDIGEVLNRLFTGRSLDNPLTQPRTSAEQARELCFLAVDTRGRRRVQLARQALQLDPQCADALVVLAEVAGTLDERLAYYRQAMEAGQKTLGQKFFSENVGHFWGISSSRPYMRARFGLAESLAATGRIDEAIEHYQELLRLNPNDNQGVRYVLLPKLMSTGRDVEAARLLKQFDEETANWTYARALLAFRLSGNSKAANRELREALRVNAHVLPLLTSDEPVPQPQRYSLGSFEEACCCVEELRPAFQATPGALDWVDEIWQQREKVLDKLRREKRRKQRAQQKKRKRK